VSLNYTKYIIARYIKYPIDKFQSLVRSQIMYKDDSRNKWQATHMSSMEHESRINTSKRLETSTHDETVCRKVLKAAETSDMETTIEKSELEWRIPAAGTAMRGCEWLCDVANAAAARQKEVEGWGGRAFGGAGGRNMETQRLQPAMKIIKWTGGRPEMGRWFWL
jgi:hypothetical protein